MKKIRYSINFFCLLFIVIGILNFPGFAFEYRIGPRDVLTVSVWGHSDLQVESKVLPDGAIYFPLTGPVEVVGKTIPEIQDALVQRLSIYIVEPIILVKVVKTSEIRVNVVGEVNKPGVYEVEFGSDILDAITIAGGPTSQADLAKVRLRSPDSNEWIEVPLGKKNQYSIDNTEKSFELVDKMIIEVPKRYIEVKVFGEVKVVGSHYIEIGSYAADAIAKAGGPTNRADLARVRICSPEDPQGMEVKVGNGRQFDDNPAVGPELREGMTIFVPETHWPNWGEVALYVTIIEGLVKIFKL